MRPKHLPEYKNPPVDEVALSVQFGALANMKQFHFGAIRERFAAGYSGTVEDHVPIEPIFELFGANSTAFVTPRIQFVQGSIPLRREWYITKDQHELVQVQADRFLQNWRKLSSEGKYVRFDNMLPVFMDNWRKFLEIAHELSLGDVVVNQGELTYFNNFDLENDETYHDAICRLFGHMLSGRKTVEPKEFTLTPENAAFSLTQIATDNGIPFARLTVSAEMGIVHSTQKRILRLTLLFRGPLTSSEDEMVSQFFRRGREAIVSTFDSMLTKDTKKVLGRSV